MQAVNAINNAITNGSVYAGIATPSSTPASGKVFYLAFTAGTYTNFNNLEVPQGINILKNNGSTWLLDSFLGIDDAPIQGSANLVKSGGVLNSIIQNGPAFDLSAYNAEGGVLATYADLSAALTALNALPADFKKGGMSIKFVLSSDNKYVQYRLISDTFNTTVDNWQGVDDAPTVNSKNLIESKAVFNSLHGNIELNTPTEGYYVTASAGTISINEQLLTEDGCWLLACAYFDPAGDTFDERAVGNAQNVVDMLGTRNLQLDGQNGNPDLGGMSIEDAYTSLLGKIGASGSNGQAVVDTQQNVVDSIYNQIVSNNSVDLNEELVDLVKFQTAYSAAAQVFNTCNNCLNTLMTLGG
jgi:flagellar hook-associated protein FlgK